jgi:hypothetical protein
MLAPFLPRVLTIRPALESFEGDFLTKVVWPHDDQFRRGALRITTLRHAAKILWPYGLFTTLFRESFGDLLPQTKAKASLPFVLRPESL